MNEWVRERERARDCDMEIERVREGKGDRSERGQTTRCHIHTFGSGIECIVYLCVLPCESFYYCCCCWYFVCVCVSVHPCVGVVYAFLVWILIPFGRLMPLLPPPPTPMPLLWLLSPSLLFVLIQWFQFLTNTHKYISFDSAVCFQF